MYVEEKIKTEIEIMTTVPENTAALRSKNSGSSSFHGVLPQNSQEIATIALVRITCDIPCNKIHKSTINSRIKISGTICTNIRMKGVISSQ